MNFLLNRTTFTPAPMTLKFSPCIPNGEKRQVNREFYLTNRYHHSFLVYSQTPQDNNFLHWKFSEIIWVNIQMLWNVISTISYLIMPLQKYRSSGEHFWQTSGEFARLLANSPKVCQRVLFSHANEFCGEHFMLMSFLANLRRFELFATMLPQI